MLVTTWGGFLAALQTEGAVIDLPGGVWDCNALVPSGFQDTIEITAAKVNGHGTVIRNLYGDMFAQTVYQGQPICEFTNMQFQNLVTQNTISAAFTDCIITGMCQRGIGSLKRCAVNIKSEAANPFVFGTSGEDSQIKVYLPVMERALKEKDVDAFESLMCANIRKNEKNLRQKMRKIMDSIDGKINTVEWESIGTSYEEKHERIIISQRGVKALIKTTKSSYRLYIDCWETINNAHPEETKIRRLTLLNSNNMVLVEIKATNGIYEWHE